MRSLATLLMMAAITLMAGCATNVAVDGSVPSPLRQPLPANAYLILDNDFKNYQYVEKEGRREVTFAIGSAQAEMFRTISRSLFQQVEEKEAVIATPARLNLYPKVEEIQLATPFGNRLKVFEVWIRYNLQVFDDEGELLADWIMTAYGKTPTRFLGSDADALNQASIVALRDAGARLSLEFEQVPEVRQWLSDRKLLPPETE
jgi:hypothetical protein